MPPAAESLVLVVDDYDDVREMYAESLRMFGYRVVEASNGAEAVEKARALHPDVIVMDLSLPGIDGWEATRQLKADCHTSHIPVLALTGHAPGHAEERARAAGCDRLLVKPALPAQVIAEVKAILGVT